MLPAANAVELVQEASDVQIARKSRTTQATDSTFSLCTHNTTILRCGEISTRDLRAQLRLATWLKVRRLTEQTRRSKTSDGVAEAGSDASYVECVTDADFCLEDLVEL